MHINEEPDLNSSAGLADKEPARARSRSTRSTEPFTKAERDEMEKLLGELCGHLGKPPVLTENVALSTLLSNIPQPVFGGRGRCEQFLIQCGSVRVTLLPPFRSPLTSCPGSCPYLFMTDYSAFLLC